MRSTFRPHSKERATVYRKILPLYIQERADSEEREWKTKVIDGLTEAIKNREANGMDFWLNSLNTYIGFEIFSLTNEEIIHIMKLLYNFITNSEQWKHVSTACSIFIDLYRPRHMDFKIELPWKPLFNVLQHLVFSHSKIKKQKPPPVLFSNFIPFIQMCTSFFPEESTDEMLDSWYPLLDPHHHSFVLGHCLLTLFLPMNAGKHTLWFDKFLSIWPMYRSLQWDFHWINLFSRLSNNEYDDIDWTPHLPFFFNTIASYIGVPNSLIDLPSCQLNDYLYDVYSVFFLDCHGPMQLIPSYTELFVNLLSHKNAKEETRKLLTNLIFLMEPYCSPQMQTDDCPPNYVIFFLNNLIQAYMRRVKFEFQYGPHLLPVLTQDDHNWFVNALKRVIIMERYTDSPGISLIKDLTVLAPEILIPPLLETIRRSFEFERLEHSGLRTMISIVTSYLYSDFPPEGIKDILEKFANNLSFMNLQRSLRIFTLFTLYARCVPIKEDMYHIVMVLMDRCLEFAEIAPHSDLQAASALMKSMISTIVRSAPEPMVKEMTNMLKEAIPRLTLKGLRDLVEPFHSYCETAFIDHIKNTVTEQDFVILLGMARRSSGFIVPNLENIQKNVIAGLSSTKKKIRRYSYQCVKHLILNLLSTLPNTLKTQGFVEIQKVQVDWHVPSQEKIDAADQLCEAFLNVADEKIKSTELTIQTAAVSIVCSVAKAIVGSIRDSDDQTPEYRNSSYKGYQQPRIYTFSVPQLKKHFIRIRAFFLNMLKVDTPSKLLNPILETISGIVTPRDRISSMTSNFLAEIQYSKETTICSIRPKKYVYDAIHIKAMQLYAYRHSSVINTFTKPMAEVISAVANCCIHPDNQVRAKVACLIQEVSSRYPGYCAEFFRPIADKFEELSMSREALSGLASALCSCCQLVFTSQHFSLIADAALSVCKTLPRDIPEDAARSLRHFMNVTFEIVDFFEDRFNMPEFVDTRRRIALTAVERAKSAAGDHELEAYATNLALQVTQGSPVLMNPEIYYHFITEVFSDDISITSPLIQSLPSLIEVLIPRVPRQNKIITNKVTPENYDYVQFQDRRLPGFSKYESIFLSREDMLDPAIIGQYFNDEIENRVKIHKAMFEEFYDNMDNIKLICKNLASQQVHHEESYCKERVQFWASLVRLLGVNFSINLLDVIEYLTDEQSLVSNHVVAGEILSSILFATKGLKYKEIEMLSVPLFPFITKVFCQFDFEFQSAWFVSIVCGLSDRDPNRFFWLFDHFMTCFPENPTQIRDIKASSLIIDITLEFGWRMPSLIQPVVEKGIMPMFHSNLLIYEQVRECGIRAVSALFGSYFSIYSSSPPPFLVSFFEDVILKAGDQFLVSWILAQCNTQTMSTLTLAQLAVNKLNDWIALCLHKTEDEEKKARISLLHLLRSNFVWACCNRPITNEQAQILSHNILQQINPANDRYRSWQAQTIMLLLAEKYIVTNFFYLGDKELDYILEEIIIPSLYNSNYDTQDSASELLMNLLKISPHLRERIPDLVKSFKELIYMNGDKSLPGKFTGVKGIAAIILSTLIFDEVPDYLIESFNTLCDAQSIDSALAPAISYTITDFWGMHDENLIPDISETLLQFRDAIRPSYIC